MIATSTLEIDAKEQSQPRADDPSSESRRDSDSLRWVSILALCVSVGVLLVAIGYARGRSVEPYSAPLYWVGELILLLAPVAFLVRRRCPSGFESISITLLIAIATYAVKVCYSPLRFTFEDEYQHLPTVQAILNTHHLFHANPTLAVSPYYPGLEMVTGAFSSLSHLSIYGSAFTVLGLAHIVTTLGIFYLAFEVVPNNRIAAFTVVVFATGQDYQTFTSYFAYESLGLPLTIVALLAFVRMSKSTGRKSTFVWGSATLFMTAATIVTHHVSSYALIALEFAVLLASCVFNRNIRSWRPVVLIFLVNFGLLAIWDLVVARPTFSYLRFAFSELLVHGKALTNVTSSVLPIAGSPILKIQTTSQIPPAFDHYTGILWALLLSAVLGFGLWRIWVQRRTVSRLVIAMAIASPVLYVDFAIDVFSPGGGELGSRLSAFALIPGGVVCGYCLDLILQTAVLSDRRTFRINFRPALRPLLLVVTSVLVLGSIAASYPPYYSRIPGPYLVGGDQRSVNNYGLSVAEWAKANLPTKSRIASDRTNSELLDSIADLPSNGYFSSLLILGTKISPAVANSIEEQKVQYVVADIRITKTVPVDGNPIFPADPFAGHYRIPIPKSSLTKFNSLPGVSRIYNNGPISVYSLIGSTYEPTSGS